MAHIYQRKSGNWRVQIERSGVRKDASFKTKEEAEEWAKQTENEVLALVSGHRDAGITLDNKELTRMYVKAKENARVRKIEFHLKRDDVVMLYGRSYGQCQVTGITFNRYRPVGATKRPWFPSIDRIDSRKPYTIENCRVVCVAANFAMGEWGEWVLNTLAKAVCYGGQPVNPPVTHMQLVTEGG